MSPGVDRGIIVTPRGTLGRRCVLGTELLQLQRVLNPGFLFSAAQMSQTTLGVLEIPIGNANRNFVSRK